MHILLRRLKKKHVWKRILFERLCEPIHLNLLTLPVALFGSFRTKVSFDLLVRQYHAFGLLRAADWAKYCGVKAISAVEFGVANGAGLLNMCEIAKRVTRETGVEIAVTGFDTGKGLPEPKDYRDHPEFFRRGDYPMQDQATLKPLVERAGGTLILGEVRASLQGFLGSCQPVGFISLDVDYYSSSMDCLRILLDDVSHYLPWVVVYADDVDGDRHSRFCGELGALHDFNEQSKYRKITKFNFLRQNRIFQRPHWISKMYVAHILDHPFREQWLQTEGTMVLENPYL